MSDCIFCKIAGKAIPAELLFEDERVVAVRDIRPAAPVHLLVIPKAHVATLNDAAGEDDALLASIVRAAAAVARAQGVAGSGYRLVVNCNRDGGQEVFHLHAHVLGGRKLGPMG